MAERPHNRTGEPAYRRARVRRGRADDLGVRRAVSGRMLLALVGAMAFLAALAMAGLAGASALAGHWRAAGDELTVQVPDPAMLGRVMAALLAAPGVVEARAVDPAALEAALEPWLGAGAGRVGLALPAVVAVRLAPGTSAEALAAAVPGASVEAHEPWLRRLAALLWRLEASAAAVVGVVGLVAAAVVAVATRAGLALRREAIEIVHGLGATDGFIAGRFARRAGRLAGWGGLLGVLGAAPVLAGLVATGFELAPGRDMAEAAARAVPPALWAGFAAVPVAAGMIGWGTAQVTVRRWLRRLP